MLNKAILEDFLTLTKETEMKGGVESCGCGNLIWTSEDWTIEVTKALMLENLNDYANLPYPDKFLNEPAFYSLIPRIVEACLFKYNCLKILEQIKDRVENLLIGEVGRGLDIIVALEVKKDWNSMICYDAHYQYKEVIDKFFSSLYNKPIEYYATPSYYFKLEVIRPNTVFILNHSRETLTRHIANENIAYIISDGILVKGVI